MKTLVINPGQLTLADLREVNRHAVKVSLNPSCHENIDRAAAIVADVIANDRTVYGINTGFGLLANTKIKADELEVLQRSIVLSHAAGIGKFMSKATVRVLMVLKINSLARGYSGIRLSVI
jgi:histidine ammonia-lyase